jgi:hypothetical protein|uniref:YopX protein n=1 Tax=Siphoviridae sp. ctjuy3 TaxID=2825637 RepID=A0A8S5U063_9CAUD|nr:MAG TPA: YopX protein [Siphoviridae sp. ctjuy3]
MIPRYRAWDKIHKTMYKADDVKYIDIEKNQIYVKTPSSEQLNCYSLRDVDLMQSTGFTDKDGKCIFKGDIVVAETGLFAGVIGIDQDLGAYVVRSIGYKYFKRLRDVASSVVVIGNIYENPEILGVRT